MLGCLARSVRDAARYYDVCAGQRRRTTRRACRRRATGKPDLGTNDLRGRRVAVVPALGGVTLEAGVEEHVRASAKQLIDATGMVEVDLDIKLPNLAVQWMMGNLSTLLADLGARWPRLCT